MSELKDSPLPRIFYPPSIDIHSCQQPEDVIDQLADADDFMDDIGSVSDMFYYQKRSFTRYVQVCLEEDIGFPFGNIYGSAGFVIDEITS